MSKLFQAAKIGKLALKNRIIMAPMQRWQGSPEGYATNYHAKHYSERAKGGVGLVIVESAAVSENGRLFPNDIGIFTDHHREPLKKVVEAVHQADTPIFIQLCHGGRKAHPETTEQLVSASALPFDAFYGTPEEMTLLEIEAIIRDFKVAARRSVEVGFDGIEIHAAHGYLIHQFLSPLSNKRTDSFGGTLENRAKLLKEVLEAIREEIGKEYPIQIRFSAFDYEQGGLTPEQIGETIELIESIGLDAVHVSTGGLLPIQPDKVFPGYQVAHAEIVKTHTQLPVIAVGLIDKLNLAEDILEKGKADFIAIGRPLLENPYLVSEWKKAEEN